MSFLRHTTQKTVGDKLDCYFVTVSQIVIQDVVGCEYHHHLDCHVVIQMHGLHIFIVNFAKRESADHSLAFLTMCLIKVVLKIPVIGQDYLLTNYLRLEVRE
jgi:hypothetical protein